jgi:hypothetical protein
MLAEFPRPLAKRTHPWNDGWYVQIAGIRDTDAAFYAFIDNSYPGGKRALWYGVTDTSRDGIKEIEAAGLNVWRVTQRASGVTAPRTFRFSEPWYQRYDDDEFYYGWLDRDHPPVASPGVPEALADRILDRFSLLLVNIYKRRSDLTSPITSAGDRTSPGKAREEQRHLRADLFKDRTAICVLCGRTLPIDLLVAAHVKPRSLCNDQERLDTRRNVIPLCALGCDALFERGYVVVKGRRIAIGQRTTSTPALRALVRRLDGRTLLNWHASRDRYFAHHMRHHGDRAKQRS